MADTRAMNRRPGRMDERLRVVTIESTNIGMVKAIADFELSPEKTFIQLTAPILLLEALQDMETPLPVDAVQFTEPLFGPVNQFRCRELTVGPIAETGVMYHYGHLSLMLGISSIGFKNYSADVGIGLSFR